MRRILIRNVPHFYDLSLDLCWKRIAALFDNVPRFGDTHRVFTGRVHTFRYSVKVRRIQRDERGARYAALISVAAARLLHSL